MQCVHGVGKAGKSRITFNELIACSSKNVAAALLALDPSKVLPESIRITGVGVGSGADNAFFIRLVDNQGRALVSNYLTTALYYSQEMRATNIGYLLFMWSQTESDGVSIFDMEKDALRRARDMQSFERGVQDSTDIDIDGKTFVCIHTNSTIYNVIQRQAVKNKSIKKILTERISRDGKELCDSDRSLVPKCAFDHIVNAYRRAYSDIESMYRDFTSIEMEVGMLEAFKMCESASKPVPIAINVNLEFYISKRP